MIEFDVTGLPVPFTRTGSRGKCRSCGSGDVTIARYSEPKYKSYREVIAWEAKAAGAKPVEGPVIVQLMVADDAISVSVAEPEHVMKYRRPRGDLDNYAKTVLDALEGIAYINDRQVVDLDASFEIR